MKRLVLFALVVFGFVSESFAQSFITQNGDTTVAYYSNGDVTVVNLIKSSNTDTVYLKWNVIDSYFDPNWTLDGFCDNKLCDQNTVSLLNGTFHTSYGYVANQWGDFHAIFKGDNAAANSYAYIRVFATDIATHYSKTLTFIARKAPTGVVTVTRSEDNIILYPNPATDNLNVIFDAGADVKNIAVYNLIGKIVSIYKVNGNSAKLNVNNIPSGIYFVRLLDGQGRVIATRKFTRQ
jgi:hypothetical protein